MSVSVNVPPPPAAPGRISHSLNGIDQGAANQDLGLAYAITKGGLGEPGVTNGHLPESRDLITRLIEDPRNNPYWEALLNNKFCKEMKKAGNDDKNILRGFLWYMKQDYHFVANLIVYEACRLSNVQTPDDFKATMARLNTVSKYTDKFFLMCTTPEPMGLGFCAEDLLKSERTGSLLEYIQLLTSAATNEDTVFSVVSMIVAIQSYYAIAKDLYEHSTHKDTPWFKFWVEDNVRLEKLALWQREYLASHYEAWRYRYDEAAELFRKTCTLELRLWDEAQRNAYPLPQ